MRKTKPGVDADSDLYAAADRALRALRDDLLLRAAKADDYEMVVQFGDRLLRYGAASIAKATGFPIAAEHAYRAADDLVAASTREAAL